MSKGSKPRPMQVSKEQFDNNWDRIFGKKHRVFEYVEYVGDGDDNVLGTLIKVTEDEIIERYWDYYIEQMTRVGKADQCTRERCIEDFCVVNWATECKE